MALNARSCILSTFLLSDDRLTKMPYYVAICKMGKIKALYSNSLALDGIKSRKRDSIPTFRLVLIHSSLICLYA